MAALVWLIIGIALIVAEVFTLDFVLIMLAVGSFAAAGIAAAGGGPVFQVIGFALVSALTVGAVRPVIKRRLEQKAPKTPEVAVGAEAIEGATAVVLERVDSDRGLVKINGETWSARAFDATQVLEPGERVQVIKVQGAIALVWRHI